VEEETQILVGGISPFVKLCPAWLDTCDPFSFSGSYFLLVENTIMTKIFSAVLCILAFALHAIAGNGYIFPDYHRILMKGQAVTLNLGIYPDGNLFLKLNESEFPIYDLVAFKRGTEQAMENTQILQQGGEGSRNFFKSRADETTLPLYTSAPMQDKEKKRYFVLFFDHHSSVNRYPIKIIFHDGTLDPQSFDFPPGELQYLQKKIDILLENKQEYINKAKLLDAQGR
jgi:hypothetical protein